MSYISTFNLFTVYMDIVRELIIYKKKKECVVGVGFDVREIVNFEHYIEFDLTILMYLSLLTLTFLTNSFAKELAG